MQALGSDGGVALHTRSTKYGRLSRGQLVCVPPRLVKRLKQHFCSLSQYGVDVILGCNGWVWVQAREVRKEEAEAMEAEAMEADGAAEAEDAPDGAWGAGVDAPVAAEEREQVIRIAAAVRLLAALGRRVSPASIVEVVDAALAWGVPSRELDGAAFRDRLLRKDEDASRMLA